MGGSIAVLRESDVHPSVWRNHEPVADVLRRHLSAADRVIEIGAGSGGHIGLLHGRLAFRTWQCTERPEALAGLSAAIGRLGDSRVPAPIALTVGTDDWPAGAYEVCVTINTLHIMDEVAVERFIESVGASLPPGGRCIVYGPFAIDGEHTSDGNRRFDAALRAAGQGQGIRDVARCVAMACAAGLTPVRRYAMPANNTMLVLVRD